LIEQGCRIPRYPRDDDVDDDARLLLGVFVQVDDGSTKRSFRRFTERQKEERNADQSLSRRREGEGRRRRRRRRRAFFFLLSLG
jgi:hypothetical protein